MRPAEVAMQRWCRASLVSSTPSCAMQAVQDPTGRQALLEALRGALIQRWAAQQGCSKVALGTNATRMAASIISLTAQGAGYGIPGRIHYLDAR